MRLLDHSAMAMYSLCKRKFYYTYTLGLTTKTKAMPLVRGGAIHKGLAEWYTNFNEARAVTAAKEAYTLDEPIKPTVEDVLVGYARTYPEDDFTVKYVEVPMAMPMGDFWYIGEADLIVNYRGDDIIIEHKTTSTAPVGWESRFKIDHQTIGYVALAQAMGLNVSGIVLNLIRTTKNIEYQRAPFFPSQDLIDEWYEDTLQVANDIYNRKDNYERCHKNTDACYNWNRACQFMEPCVSAGDYRSYFDFYAYRDQERERSIFKRALERRHAWNLSLPAPEILKELQLSFTETQEQEKPI